MDTKSIKIGIFKLTRTEHPEIDEWGCCIVAASTEKEARELANQEAKAEGYLWTDGHRVSSEYLGDAVDGISGVLLSSMDIPE